MGRRIPFLVAVAFALPVSGAAASPAKTLATSLASAHKERSVHYESNGTTAGAHVSMVSDVAVDRGIQRITYTKSGQAGHVTVLVVAHTAYIRGDAFTLHNYMGFPKNDAAGYAGKWIVIPQTSSGYASVAAGVQLASAVDELKQLGPFTGSSAMVRNGQRVVGLNVTRVSAGQRTTVTVFVQSTRAELPVGVEAHQGTNSFQATFARWNEPVTVHAPAHVVHLANSA